MTLPYFPMVCPLLNRLPYNEYTLQEPDFTMIHELPYLCITTACAQIGSPKIVQEKDINSYLPK